MNNNNRFGGYKIPIQPTVYRNKALIPTNKIYYESIDDGHRSISDRSQQTPDLDLKNMDELSNSVSVLSHTVNLSPQQSVFNDQNLADIDLESIVEEKISALEVRNAITRADNDDFRKADVSL